MPKINDLTTRPGGPQPTDEFWLASAGAAADFKSTIAALTAAVLGNISVSELIGSFEQNIHVTNAGASSLRWPNLMTAPSSARSGGGIYTLTWPSSFAVNSAQITAINQGDGGMVPTLSGFNSNVLTVEMRDPVTGALAYGAFMARVVLLPA